MTGTKPQPPVMKNGTLATSHRTPCSWEPTPPSVGRAMRFAAWAHPHFAKGAAWAFHAVHRNVKLSADGKVAWFDEELVTQKLGPCRGSGVLLLQGRSWRIAHYVLSVPVPNAVFDEVKRVIEQGPQQPVAPDPAR